MRIYNGRVATDDTWFVEYTETAADVAEFVTVSQSNALVVMTTGLSMEARRGFQFAYWEGERPLHWLHEYMFGYTVVPLF